MENHPLVSVIIPVYNGDRYLAEAIETVLTQTYQLIEIIVVDDGSIDNSAEIAKGYKEVKYFYQPNQGVSVARNVGIAAAQGEFLAFLDADDIWTNDKISKQVNYLCQHPQIGYVVCHSCLFLEPTSNIPPGLNLDKLFKVAPVYIPSALVIRKSALEKIGVFAHQYRLGEGMDWFFRANEADICKAIVPEVLLHKRIHDRNLSYELRHKHRLQLVKSYIERQHDR
ncbi:MAG: glycosyltransferase family 2 protein [Aphanothece sp. CMT-3BRIN-NPC111]|jgi:glycosyltransferase involved in cell wall biosynthesis|nr:glycosyltransferase family 2 protein [Aphanothece sp. CMT-3BRIN-NPC111]